MSSRLEFQREKHVRYLLRCLQMLPTAYQAEDCSRMSLAFFVLSSLDLLGALDKLKDVQRREYVDWIYAQQVSSTGGFRGGPFIGNAKSPTGQSCHEPAHIAMTYTALLNLAILGDDLGKLNRAALLSFVASCQAEDGSFAPFPGSNERDVRFVYCAFVILSLFDAWERIDLEKAILYLLSCRSYDHAFGQMPGLEAQGGTTYCVLASLHLCGRLSRLAHRDKTLDWLVHRFTVLDTSALDEDDYDVDDNDDKLFKDIADSRIHVSGFQGRPEKDPDACYSFWIGASIRLLTSDDARLFDARREDRFLLLCQYKMGGIAKFPDEYPDVYHTYLALAALSISGSHGLKSLDSAINLSQATAKRLRASIRDLSRLEEPPAQ